MIETVGVRFRSGGKIYTFSCGNLSLSVGDQVVVKTAKGQECGVVATAPEELAEEGVGRQISPVLRKATEKDLKKIQKLADKEQEALNIFREKIVKHKLNMKPVKAEFAFDDSKLLFYFTADGRIDFRDLVKDLASIFHMRIELRQIGVRDEARMLGGLGICGRQYCCSSFLDDFHPVSIKMAKNQEISLNPTKISGACGRLMCCLKYEEDAYEELNRITPRAGSSVKVNGQVGVVVDVSIISGLLKVRLRNRDDEEILVVHRSEVERVKRGRSEEETFVKPERAMRRPKRDDKK